MRRLGLSLLAALAGWLVARPMHISALAHTSWYMEVATLLLAVGLFSSTHSISLPDARAHWRLVLAAVTLGVVAKAAMIALVMVACFHRSEYLVLGIAVAQIDPLAVAAQARGKHISDSARTILYAWASFDDPVTVLLTVYLSAIALGGHPARTGLDGFLLGLLPNLLVALVAAAWARWRWRGWARSRAAAGSAPPAPGPVPVPVGALAVGATATATLVAPAPATSRTARGRMDMLDVAFIALLLVGAAHFSLLLGVAIAGLYLRPAAFSSLDRVTRVAFYLAALALGLVLAVRGSSVVAGTVLGVTAFAAQAVVATVLAHRLPWSDRRYLMLAQQNGITAIVLALILESDFPGTVGIIAPAVLVVNALNAVTNTYFESGPAALLAPLRALRR
jgi:NhaP-type Na+/H+ or K+/H+ antiporter